MIVGVPKEIKNHEYRVGLTPEAVGQLTRVGYSTGSIDGGRKNWLSR